MIILIKRDEYRGKENNGTDKDDMYRIVLDMKKYEYYEHIAPLLGMREK